MDAKTKNAREADQQGSGALAANVTSGLVLGVLNITTAISIAALVFAGMPSRFFVMGVNIVLLSTVVCGVGGVISSGFGQVISAPRSGLAPIYATIVASVAAALPAASPALAPTLLVAIMTATLVTGLFLFVVGQFRLGNLIRLMPYPVMAGFFAGIGLVFVLGGVAVASGQALTLKTMAYHFSATGLELTLPAIVLGVLLYTVSLKVDHWSVFPLLIVVAVAVFYVVLHAIGSTVPHAIAAGWLPKPAGASASFPLSNLSALHLVNWAVVLKQGGAMATIAVLATISCLVDTSGIELIANADLDPDRELKTVGITNIVNGALGGYAGTVAAADTALAVKLGATSKVSTSFYVGLVAVVMLLGTSVVNVIPSYVLGGLIFYFGLDFLIAWAWSKRSDFPLHDYAIVLAILGAIAFVGLLEGIAIGFGIAVVLFVIRYSRLSVVKNEYGGDVHESFVVRRPELRDYLAKASQRIWIMKLQGFLFFGTADRILRTIKGRVERAGAPGISHLVLDFLHVSEVDTSAVQMITKLRRYADRERLSVVLSGLDESARRRLEEAGSIDAHAEQAGASRAVAQPTLDAGVAWCEADLLDEFEQAVVSARMSLENLLARLTGKAESAKVLAPFFTREEVPKGTFLFREGEESTSLFLLERGSAAVIVNADTEQERVIRIFAEGTMLGEMGLFTGAPRSASVRAESDGVFYRLTRSDFFKAQMAHPLPTGQLQSYMVRILAERLDRATRVIQSFY